MVTKPFPKLLRFLTTLGPRGGPGPRVGRAAVLGGLEADALPGGSSRRIWWDLDFVTPVDACFKKQILLLLRCGEARG